MLPTSLTTNEVKNEAGTEVEFQTRKLGPGNAHEYAKIGETPALPHRLIVSHAESGTGSRLIRRSLCRFDLSFLSETDLVTPCVVSGYTVLVLPVGHITTATYPNRVMANLNSFLATTGAATTVLFDGTGTGTAALRDGLI